LAQELVGVSRGNEAVSRITYIAIDAEEGLEAPEESCLNQRAASLWLKADRRRNASIAAC
jgi:hypothetical protein